MIFSLGIFCCVLGYLYGNEVPFSEEAFTRICRQMTCHVLDDFQGVTVENARTHGERLYALYGITGIRGEAAKGFPTVFDLALPVFRTYKIKGLSVNDAGVLTLLHIIAGAVDTNIVARSDYETMKEIQRRVRGVLEAVDNNGNGDIAGKMPDYISVIRELDWEFIERNISPGGSADMLALTYFVESLCDY
jgi:holo-ACP synthase/triphosphoribosyl-dephospho-CoA synthase